MNLPWQVKVRGATGTKGTITYIYDAAGNKLKKTTIDSAGNIQTVTTYIGGFQYQGRQALTSGSTTPADTLQFFGQEEGRVRVSQDTTGVASNTSFKYDYFLKDHLGNTRLVLTDEQETDMYPAATMELADSATENLYYSKLDATRSALPAGYPTDTTTNPNNYVIKVGGFTGESKIGPGITLKVMAGDKFSIRATSWYKTNGTQPGTSGSPLSDLVTALISGVGGLPGSGHPAQAVLQSNSTAISGNVTKFLSDTGTAITETKPHAFVNWVLFDNQLNYVSSSSGFDQVGADQEFKHHILTNLPVDKSGYLYIYVSNETPNIDVFFDNLQVTHVRGPMLEEDHYYPFGLAMAGISDKALKTQYSENKNRFNGGNELQSKEFSDGSGLETYDAGHRMYDQQTGHFGQPDALADMSQSKSPYSFASDNPISINDPLGLSDSLPPVTVIGYAKNKASQFINWFTGADVGYTGSGWGHGPRQWLANQLGLGNNANSLLQMGLQSMLQNSHINLTGQLLNKLKTDPAMVAFQKKIIAALKADPRFGKLTFVTKGGQVIGFGGERWSSQTEKWGALNGSNPLAHSETWDVAGNELTWAVRHAEVDYNASVKGDGTIVISYHLSDQFDLSAQKGRSEAYNTVSAASGFLYHDVAGGNSDLKVSADWQATTK